MKKKVRSRTKKRMTEEDISNVVYEIMEWKHGCRGEKLTWQILEKIFPFTRQTMFSKKRIKIAYLEAQDVLKGGKVRDPLEEAENHKIKQLNDKIKVLEEKIDNWTELWTRFEYNILVNGWNRDLLERPIPKVDRKR